MNLWTVISTLAPSHHLSHPIPDYLYGAFRRKSITFFNGLTDENTIVYWFQSRSFTIDLRLKSQTETPIIERQGWIGHTHWDANQQLLSWDVSPQANYQNYIQWPEPAKLHMIGNSILEFSPSNVYVEDWRQQVRCGIFLGLRLKSALDITTGETLHMDGGIIICGNHIAYALTRLPETQHVVQAIDFKTADHLYSDAIESFEVSVSIDGQKKQYSTSSKQIHQTFNFDNFEIIDDSTLLQHIQLNGRHIDLIFDLDIYIPNYHFQHDTPTTPFGEQWLNTEKNHLMHHAKLSL